MALSDRFYSASKPLIESVLTPRPTGFNAVWDDLWMFRGDPNNAGSRAEVMMGPMHEIVRRACVVDRTWLLRFMKNKTTIFEGAQGVLLDQVHGFQPHTTWSDCTFGNANMLLDGFAGDITRLGVTRAFMTRHGAGPLPTESPALAPLVAHDHNKTGPWQGAFRVGALDLPLLRYASNCIDMLDGLCVTNLDRLDVGAFRPQIVCTEYEVAGTVWHTMRAGDLRTVKPWHILIMPRTALEAGKYIASELSVPLHGISTGPTYTDKTWTVPSCG